MVGTGVRSLTGKLVGTVGNAGCMEGAVEGEDVDGGFMLASLPPIAVVVGAVIIVSTGAAVVVVVVGSIDCIEATILHSSIEVVVVVVVVSPLSSSFMVIESYVA